MSDYDSHICRGPDYPHIFSAEEGPCLCGKVKCRDDALYIQKLERTWRRRVVQWLWRHGNHNTSWFCWLTFWRTDPPVKR